MGTIYRIDINNTYGEVHFDFKDYGEMVSFLGMALESGHKDKERIKVSVSVIDEEVGLNE